MFHPPGLRHQRTLGALQFALYRPAEDKHRGILLGTCGVILANDTFAIPDLLYISRERRHILGKEYIEGPPDLVAEVISRSSAHLDKVRKRSLYARYGVRNYWLVDPAERWVRAYVLGADGSYELAVEAHDDTQFAAPPFPDLPIELARLWDDRL